MLSDLIPLECKDSKNTLKSNVVGNSINMQKVKLQKNVNKNIFIGFSALFAFMKRRFVFPQNQKNVKKLAFKTTMF